MAAHEPGRGKRYLIGLDASLTSVAPLAGPPTRSQKHVEGVCPGCRKAPSLAVYARTCTLAVEAAESRRAAPLSVHPDFEGGQTRCGGPALASQNRSWITDQRDRRGE